MNENNFLTLTKNLDPKLTSTIKDVYKLIYDLKVNDWEIIFLSNDKFIFLKKLATKKINGEDITFDIGYRYFRNNKLKLKKGVFVPQFDTEQIVDLLINLNIKNGDVLEIGTGTGAIPISISNETKLNVISIDVNNDATKLGIENDINKKVNFINIDFNNFESKNKYDVIISNPPYIDVNDEHVEEWVKNNQPKEALFAEKNGIAFYELIFSKSKKLLKDKGYIILEIGFNQKDDLTNLIKKYYSNFKFVKDYSGYDRFVVVKNYE